MAFSLLRGTQEAGQISESDSDKSHSYFGSRFSNVDTRVELLEGDAEGGRTCERWQFDEDAYTLGLHALYTSNMPASLPTLLFSLLAPALQGFICLLVFQYFSSQASKDAEDGSCLSAQIVCSGLCILQLGNEAVEGFYKVLFSIRWAFGFYDVPYCPVSSTAGVMLGLLQVVMGLIACVLCIAVIFTATSTLDAFFNFVALAFIADLDNLITNSRLVRSFQALDPVIEAWWPSDEKMEGSTVRRCWLSVACNAPLLMGVPMNIALNVVRNQGLEDPVEFHWLWYLPRSAMLWLLGNAVMWFGGKWFGPCRAAFGLTIVDFLMQAVPFLVLEPKQSPGSRGCLLWTPLDTCVFWLFGAMALPASFGAELRPFRTLGVVPLQVKLMIASALMWSYQIFHHGCG